MKLSHVDFFFIVEYCKMYQKEGIIYGKVKRKINKVK